MATRLNEAGRELLERTLDAFASATDAQDYSEALRLYERAVSLVRERPAGERRVRSDFNQARRDPAQMDLH